MIVLVDRVSVSSFGFSDATVWLWNAPWWRNFASSWLWNAHPSWGSLSGLGLGLGLELRLGLELGLGLGLGLGIVITSLVCYYCSVFVVIMSFNVLAIIEFSDELFSSGEIVYAFTVHMTIPKFAFVLFSDFSVWPRKNSLAVIFVSPKIPDVFMTILYYFGSFSLHHVLYPVSFSENTVFWSENTVAVSSIIVPFSTVFETSLDIIAIPFARRFAWHEVSYVELLANSHDSNSFAMFLPYFIELPIVNFSIWFKKTSSEDWVITDLVAFVDCTFWEVLDASSIRDWIQVCFTFILYVSPISTYVITELHWNYNSLHIVRWRRGLVIESREFAADV